MAERGLRGGEPAAADRTADLERLRVSRDLALQAAREALRDTTRLTRLLAILGEPGPLEGLLDRVLATLSELFAADIVILVDPRGTGSLAPRAAIGLPEDMLQKPLASWSEGYVAEVMRSGSPVITAQAQSDPLVAEHLRDLGVEGIVWLPVIGSHLARGVLLLARCRPEAFAQADVGLLSAMAYRIALALEQAQRSFQFEQIVRSSRVIAGHLNDESAVAADAVSTMAKVVGANAALLALRGPDGGLGQVAWFGPDFAADPAWLPLLEHLLGDDALSQGSPYATADLRGWMDRFGFAAPTQRAAKALLVVPIRRADSTQGLLCAIRVAPMAFSPDCTQVASLYASQVSAALENTRLYQAVRNELAERARIERALRASDDRFRALIRSVSDVIAILASDGTFTLCQRGGRDHVGLASRDIDRLQQCRSGSPRRRRAGA